MRFQFHNAVGPGREVGFRPLRERCRLEPAARQPGKPSVGSSNSTIVAVNLDLGRSNALFIRGQGGGLRWDKGQILTCIDPKTWVWSAGAANCKLEFQLLLNDEVWERGQAHILEPGSSIQLTPDFEWPEIPRISSAETNAHHLAGSS